MIYEVTFAEARRFLPRDPGHLLGQASGKRHPCLIVVRTAARPEQEVAYGLRLARQALWMRQRVVAEPWSAFSEPFTTWMGRDWQRQAILCLAHDLIAADDEVLACAPQLFRACWQGAVKAHVARTLDQAKVEDSVLAWQAAGSQGAEAREAAAYWTMQQAEAVRLLPQRALVTVQVAYTTSALDGKPVIELRPEQGYPAGSFVLVRELEPPGTGWEVVHSGSGWVVGKPAPTWEAAVSLALHLEYCGFPWTEWDRNYLSHPHVAVAKAAYEAWRDQVLPNGVPSFTRESLPAGG